MLTPARANHPVQRRAQARLRPLRKHHPALINSGLAMAAVTTTSLIGVVVLRKR